MSVFYCAECDNLRDADDGCEETADGLNLICVECVAEAEEAAHKSVDDAVEALLALSALPVEGGDQEKQEFSPASADLSRASPSSRPRLPLLTNSPPPDQPDILGEALERPNELAQLPALIMANIEGVPNWREDALLLTAHCHAFVLHNDLPDALAPPPDHDPQHGGWRDIASAPRDGTWLLVWDGTNVTAAHYQREFEYQYDSETDSQDYRGAWTDETVASWGYQETNELKPTHWQPLPAPPAVTALSGGGNKDLGDSSADLSPASRSPGQSYDGGEG